MSKRKQSTYEWWSNLRTDKMPLTKLEVVVIGTCIGMWAYFIYWSIGYGPVR